MTAEQILEEIRALPGAERAKLVAQMRQLTGDEIPQDFIEALEDFEKGRFVPMETVALLEERLKDFRADPQDGVPGESLKSVLRRQASRRTIDFTTMADREQMNDVLFHLKAVNNPVVSNAGPKTS